MRDRDGFRDLRRSLMFRLDLSKQEAGTYAGMILNRRSGTMDSLIVGFRRKGFTVEDTVKTFDGDVYRDIYIAKDGRPGIRFSD